MPTQLSWATPEQVPPGFVYRPDFVTQAEEHDLGVDAGVIVTPVNPAWSTAEAVSVEILRRSCTYQPLNAFFLTWLQLAEFIWTEMIHRDNAYDREFKEMIEAPTPSLDEINTRPDKYELLKTSFSLEEDFGDLKTAPETEPDVDP
jgi:hypothetical protein